MHGCRQRILCSSLAAAADQTLPALQFDHHSARACFDLFLLQIESSCPSSRQPTVFFTYNYKLNKYGG